jgi:hypothetical protein
MSLKQALETLGLGPCHHMEEIFEHPEQVPFWAAVASRKKVNWDEVFSGYRAQVDWPGAHVWRELAAAYPQAKVIHTVRPDEQWWNSFSSTIAVVLAKYQEMPAPPHIRAMMEAASTMIGTETFAGRFGDREAAIAAYRRRTEEVRAAIPAGRLLVFDVAEGWGPLCAFLGAPVPTTPFPRVNSTEDFWKMLKG